MSFYDDKNVIAKSNGISLKKHSYDTLKIMSLVLESDYELLHNRFKLLNISDSEDVLNNLKKASFFHDFGKATEHWQKKAKLIENKENSLPPHALNSGFFLKMTSINEIIALLSVISHHTLLTDKSFENYVNYSPKFIEDYLINLTDETDFYLNKFNSFGEYMNHILNFKNQCGKIKKLYNNDINLLFKVKYSFFLSYLTFCDGLSSEFEENNIEISKKDVLNKHPSSFCIYEKLKKIDDKYKLNPIQNEIYKIKNSNEMENLVKPILMEAPCGEGKTLASLIYSKILFKNNLINKVIFALPTQVTSNNMFFEFENEYNIPKEWIGIYHSEVLNFLIKNNDTNYTANIEKYKNIIYSKVFNISTIDHLLLTLVNGYKYAPRGFGNILNSLIIIDELHYYDSHTLALIEVLCEILRYLKIPHIIMSATIPKFIKNRFNKDYCKIQSSGQDLNHVEKNPFKFTYHTSEIYEDDYFSDDFLKVLRENIDNNLGIIVNTVPLSQKIYKDIKKLYPEKQILLYNSRFMKKDRPLKENIIKAFSNCIYEKDTDNDRILLRKYGFEPGEKFIFIGTQVAEISLNISFDTIISQLAPFDAIIQRGGRLHRKMTFNNSKDCECVQCKKLKDNHEFIMHIFDTGKYCYPYYTKDDKNDSHKSNIINNTREILIKNPKYTFKNSILLMDEVYNDNSFLIDDDVKYEYRKKLKRILFLENLRHFLKKVEVS